MELKSKNVKDIDPAVLMRILAKKGVNCKKKPSNKQKCRRSKSPRNITKHCFCVSSSDEMDEM